MTITGKTGAAHLLTAQLDQRALVRLGRDLLFGRGHKDIRCVDGPGDGGRDIHSLDKNRERHLAQCKFHADANHACSSADVAELPMAMIKFGCKRGTFLTNSRITPQGKREYLDAYPGLALEFLDGDTLAEEVLDNPLLRSVWFDGASIARVNNAIIIPLIIRAHDRDVPVHPLRYFASPNPTPMIRYLEARHPSLKFSVRTGTARPQSFDSYRPPRITSMEEGWSTFLQVTEVVVEGDSLLSDIPTLAADVCKAAAVWVGEKVVAFTVKSAEPYIGGAQYSASDPRVVTGLKGESLIQTRHSAGYERDWFCALPQEGWSDDTDARVTEADWIRLYCVDGDFCVAYEIESHAAGDVGAERKALRRITQSGWMRSVFCLHPRWDSWSASFPPPDETIAWTYDNRILCGWFHWTLLGGAIPIPSESEEPFIVGPSEEAEATRLDHIRSHLASVPGVEEISPERARHMVALVGNDPLSDQEVLRYRTAEVTAYPETLPSPIEPLSRRFEVCVAWRAADDSAVIRDLLVGRSKSCRELNVQSTDVDVHGPFVVLTLAITPHALAERSTPEILLEIEVALRSWLATVEVDINRDSPHERSTREYWRAKYDVQLATSWSKSDKTYVWRRTADGRVVHVDAQEFLTRGTPLDDDAT